MNPRDISSFLYPLVQELLLFWRGDYLNVFGYAEPQLVRGAVLCVACDMPASKKVGGFLGHAARHGCSKCMKEFPGSVGNKDYSGFNWSSWTSRTNDNHRSLVKRTQQRPNKTQRQRLESEYGCRYSVMLELAYFDPIKMVVVDPMHNLFLVVLNT